MGRLHRLPNYSDEVVAEGAQVCLVAQLRGECLKGLPRIVLVAIEAAVYERLDIAAQWVEERCDHDGGGDDGELRKVLSAGKGLNGRLGDGHAAEIERNQHSAQRTVDEGAVDDAIDVVKTVAQNGEPDGYRDQ